MSRVSIIDSISDEELKEIVKNCACRSDVLRQLGLSTKGSSNFNALNARLEELGCDFGQAMKQRGGSVAPRDLSYYLQPHIVINNFSTFKNRLLKEGILENKCAICGNVGVWNNKPLVLVLDHIDGDKYNNVVKNLRMLCPNCDSQTITYKGRNAKQPKYEKKKYYCERCGVEIESNKAKLCVQCASLASRKVKDRPSKEALSEMLVSESYTSIGKKYGVSDNAVRKWCKSYGLL